MAIWLLNGLRGSFFAMLRKKLCSTMSLSRSSPLRSSQSLSDFSRIVTHLSDKPVYLFRRVCLSVQRIQPQLCPLMRDPSLVVWLITNNAERLSAFPHSQHRLVEFEFLHTIYQKTFHNSEVSTPGQPKSVFGAYRRPTDDLTL